MDKPLLLPDDLIVIVGAGGMGRAIAHDLIFSSPSYKVCVIDQNQDSLDKLQRHIQSDDLFVIAGDCGDNVLINQLFQKARLCIGAADYRFNLELSRRSIANNAHWIDLGGNNDVVAGQFELDDDAQSQGVTVIPDCGLAPGMVSIIGADAFNRLDEVEGLHFRVGGLPQNPQPPLNYALCFSPAGLINEYVEPAKYIEDGTVCEAPSLTGLEDVEIGSGFGTLEAFHTSGGASTMIETFAGRLKRLDYKTLRYPGHCRDVKLLSDLGIFDSIPVTIKGDLNVSPREVMTVLLTRLGWVKEDVVLLKSWAVGSKDGIGKRITYALIDRYDPSSGLTAMARTTGFSAVILARMILDGRISSKGVIRQELGVPPVDYFSELKQRGINISITETKL